MNRVLKLAPLCLCAALLCGCPHKAQLSGRVIDLQGPVANARVLGMVWLEDAATARPAPELAGLSGDALDAVYERDLKDRGLPSAYARGIADGQGWFTLDKLHFSPKTKKAVNAMKRPVITRVSIWAFGRGYLKSALTAFPARGEEFPAATVLVFKPADWKELYRDNTVHSLAADYLVRAYSKEFGATKKEKSWMLEYTHSNLWQAYAHSEVVGDKDAEELCGRDYSDVVITDAGMRRDPAHEKCAELLRRMGEVREVEGIWLSHMPKKADEAALEKELVRNALAELPAELSEPRTYESAILAGVQEAAQARVNGRIAGQAGGMEMDAVQKSYAKGVKAEAYQRLGAMVYDKYLSGGGALPAVELEARILPYVRDELEAFWQSLNRPLTAQAATNATSSRTDAPATEGADSVPIEEYVPKVIVEGKWGTGPGEFGRQGDVGYDLKPTSLAVDSKGNIYILDYVNNRIQKYSGSGKHLKDIEVDGLRGPVQCWAVKRIDEQTGEIIWSVGGSDVKPANIPDSDLQAYIWPPETQGMNIVIDSKDTLYYYLKRIKNRKESWEVWEFRNDKVVEKHASTQKGGLPAKFILNPIGDNQFELGVAASVDVAPLSKYHVDVQKIGESSQIVVKDPSGKMLSKTEVAPSETFSIAKRKYGRAKSNIHFERLLDNGNFRVRVVDGAPGLMETEEREYTPEGKLVRRIKSPPGFSHGIEVGETGIKVIRWDIQKIQ